MDPVDQRRFDNQRSEALGAREAAAFLGVKLQTLYAYASRGLVRSDPGPKGRRRHYVRADLERLRSRQEARSGHGPVAAGALQWGEPVLRTRISAIGPLGPLYRDRSAVELARQGVRFETVAELLWAGSIDGDVRWPAEESAGAAARLRRLVPAGHPPLQTLLAGVPRLALLDPDRFGAPREAEWRRARRLLRVMAALLAFSRGGGAAIRALGAPTIADAAAIALGVSPGRARAAIDATLVVAADHELNASTFAARVVASTGADLYACVAGGLAALTGPLHGGASDRVEALLDEIGTPARAYRTIALRTGRGEGIPGFGHPLYPGGDPRFPLLFEVAARAAGRTHRPRLATLVAVVRAMERARRAPPNLDVGLVAVVRALGLPRGSGAALFALGRTAGYIAHALEQRELGQLLRPRAEYVGAQESDDASSRLQR